MLNEETYNLENEEPRLITPEEIVDEQTIEINLRPQTLLEFIGQDHIKEPLSISIEASKKRNESIEHVLLYGNPGLGKTTLANIIAREMGSNIRITAGPALERVGDLAAILSNLEAGDVLFIDEIHRMNKTIEEVMYSAMEDYALDIIVGKGPAARTLRMPLERFTLIGATTKLNLLSSPLRDRFGHVYHLNFYENDDIKKIVHRSASILEMDIKDNASDIISSRSRRTPRVANRLLRRVRDYAEVRHNGIISDESTIEALTMLNVDKHGLDEVDRKILTCIIEKFDGGPVGLNTLAAAIAEDMDTIETIYEPYLLQIGMLERTPRGRLATRTAYDHINVTKRESTKPKNFKGWKM
ncbi:MAG: Holliday junction DNA helicase RuvB [Candidatus Magasanikbacteria bacterium RIFCSPHIGHO2_01_FULL_33_34]|uniref:Holliday junction branch migration complex subunit RuvB n=1 Tax=Candidatus Magasanikbacteria bacterium RIFCSPHIGHO2_01_FULL_33_34 TaxID=1798671 RepID=A0A1F6LKB0_9BACT|nr:MAG: Holliday junction DNA helicase RuvB [Candidatus Magasanikbacteria bacterium RIFCSPHIGHO2_01_FULL_33_34]OGH65631.1 MAG: Holliday junction DNA helicase RuvB [Candidatus Magasanikbacteria bacterium RIFCSPHIGHO2_02_FULL_33_17]OGH75840.1 MAG: Holliday junction DNA helicase RuvB [Candidatus Magasanikbacteria bacterium RIFCSPLOWO2_01_FULL_33_34]OGH81148.1 MAG: Holliday junction DNA helicase RuvB [Candidatus Magasanikbacteria bacterium RIFCSPLOWO2_12_FULL_34_7]